MPRADAKEDMPMKISSPHFSHNQMIPREFTCEGNDVNPELIIENIPPKTKTLALIVDDPDAPVGTWVHWVVFNIDPKTTTITKESIPGLQGINDFGKLDYGGPCPPSGTHRYFFKVYALDTTLAMQEGASKKDVENAMRGHILDEAELIGLYSKK